MRGRPHVVELKAGEPLADADDVEGIAEAGRGGRHLARAVQGREHGLRDTHPPPGRRAGRSAGWAQAFQGEP